MERGCIDARSAEMRQSMLDTVDGENDWNGDTASKSDTQVFLLLNERPRNVDWWYQKQIGTTRRGRGESHYISS